MIYWIGLKNKIIYCLESMNKIFFLERINNYQIPILASLVSRHTRRFRKAYPPKTKIEINYVFCIQYQFLPNFKILVEIFSVTPPPPHTHTIMDIRNNKPRNVLTRARVKFSQRRVRFCGWEVKF